MRQQPGELRRLTSGAHLTRHTLTPMTLAAAVVDEVRRRLTARNMSQTALARAAGIAPTLMHRTMNAERVFDLAEFEAVAAALDVTPLYLLRQSLENGPTRTGDTASD